MKLFKPKSVVIDFSETSPAKELKPLVINNPNVSSVVPTELTSSFGPITRVEIGLNRDVEYKTRVEGNKLFVDIVPEKKEKITIQKPKPKVLPPANAFIGINIEKKGADVKAIVSLNGSVSDYNFFKLDKPARLILDIWKVKNLYKKKRIRVTRAKIKSVRIGTHKNKVRIVFDSANPRKFPSFKVAKADDKIVVWVSEKPIPESEMISIASPVDEKGIKKGIVTGLDFQNLDKKSRITISTSSPAVFKVSKPRSKRVIVDLKGVKVPKRYLRGLDTSEFKSAVNLVTMINVRREKERLARAIIKLKEDTNYNVTQVGNKIYIDFDIPKSILSAPKKETVKPEVKVIDRRSPEAKEKIVKVRKKKVYPYQTVKTKVFEKKEEVKTGIPGKVYTGRRVSFDFKDADIKNVLRLIAEVSNLNIIAGDNVKGTITLRLVNVPWDQALDLILETKGLGMVKIGNVIRIAPRKVIIKEKEEAIKLAKLETEFFPLSYSNAKDVSAKVKKVLSKEGKIEYDDRTNTIIITDIRKNLEQAKKYIKTLDAPTKQVLIESRIVEASLGVEQELGIQWGGHYKADTAHGNATGLNFPNSIGIVGGGDNESVINLPAAVGPGSGGIINLALGSVSDIVHLDISLSALENKGKGRVISSPRVTTLNNKEASITQGFRIPYLKITEQGVTSTDWIDANLKLTVKPQITHDGNIKMELTISKDTPDWSKTVLGTPAIYKQEVKTEVLVKNNDVIVLGGVFINDDSVNYKSVPGAGDVPVLGWFFKKKSKANKKTELLVFISPRIIEKKE